MKFIPLTSLDGDEYYLSINAILTLEEREAGTYILLMSGDNLYVKESMRFIINYIKLTFEDK